MTKQTNTIEQTTETTTTETAVAQFDFGAKFKELGEVKSPMIRFMASLAEFQKSTGAPDIGKINKAFETAGVKMRYQHVRNVLNTPVKKTS